MLRIPAIRVAVVLSLLLHAAALWGWVPRPTEAISDRAGRGKGGGALAVRLAPAPSPATSAAPAVPESSALQPPPPAAKRAPPPQAAPRPPPPPKIATKDSPAPAVAAAPVEPPAAAPAPLESDFFSQLEARRRARGATAEASPSSAPPAEDERARHNRIVAENLGLNRVPTYGREPTGGGIFQLERIGYNDAEFIFYGWNKDIRRRAKQTILVQKGDSTDIRLAVVRKMITIIRDHESGDFVWLSTRLGREVTLSARPGDNAGLENFLMQEFFPGSRPG